MVRLLIVKSKGRAMLLPVISIAFTAISIATGGILSFWAYSLPRALLLPPPYTGWTVFIIAVILWCVSLICAISALVGKRSVTGIYAFIFSLSAPILVFALATAIFLIGLNSHHTFTF